MNDVFAQAGSSYWEAEDIHSLWNLAEDFSITDAASLIAGYDPVMVERCKNDTFFDRTFFRYPVAFTALTHAIINGRVKATIRYSAREYGYADEMADLEYYEAHFMKGVGTSAEEGEILSNDNSYFYHPFPDWSVSTITRDDLMEWLRSRGIRDGYFFQSANNAPDYLDPNNPRYAPKLAAAVQAWQAVTDPIKQSPMQALKKWLREHAAEFGLTGEDGNPVNQAIEECSKVANWKPGGGAPKTSRG
jgi:hypothetical protein